MQKINVYMNSGGLGDRICQLPAIIYCLKQYPHVSMDILAPDYFVDLARHFLRGHEERAQVIPMSRIGIAGIFDANLPAVSFCNMWHTTLRTHLVDHAFRIINDSDYVTPANKNYPCLRLDEVDTVHFKLPGMKYVVLTPGYTAKVRQLPSNVWNEIATWLRTQGFAVVWLGAQSIMTIGPLKPDAFFGDGLEILESDFDLRDKTTLLEAGKIMALADAVVGLDNGLMHLAGCTDTWIIGGFTSVDPRTRLPYRRGQLGWRCKSIEPPSGVPCKFRQTLTHFDYQSDFRECPCNGAACVASLTAEKFITELEKVV